MTADYRYEIKFILDHCKFAEAKRWLYLEAAAYEAYPCRTINSLYFDDYEFSAVRDNLSGVSKRKKFRLRWYGHDGEQSRAVFEIKERNGRLGRKSGFPIQFEDQQIQSLKLRGLASVCTEHLLKNKTLIEGPLSPTLFVCYEREYFETHSGVRITFDNGIHFSDTGACSALNELVRYPYHAKIMEIKFPSELKDKVANLTRSLHFTPKRHSKYLAGLASLGYAVYL